jgi:type I restriction enzyme S subunit
VVTKGAFAYNPARVNIGSLGRNEYDFDGAVSPVYVVFECKDGYENFFDLYRRTERFKTEVSLRAIGGVRQSLNYTDFAMIQTIIAPQNVLDAFNPLFDNIKETQRHIEKENSRLASLRDTLLPRLMSGELNVFDKPNDQS